MGTTITFFQSPGIALLFIVISSSLASADLNAVEERDICYCYRELNHCASVVQAVA
jgi:hypothetical protein